ncbi:molybdopterin-binding oxidoreductase [Wenjunlia vitaminophila]|uniref:Molybdopterin-binding oxidoreductase n=1 Tax=Wenjunlia vitaminophila TaxID=76728 RepID=A0A0T6LKF3_WENVI|nr:molybdopterin-dependent oxidoreductase [Wenjunlia vitaminophila]KRV46518.1 molybdopterin-binding oxidoreductase [Wenjunlia vitaminophila]
MTRTAHRICPLCEASCGLTIELDGDRATRVRGNAADVFSKGYVCPKGIALGDLDQDPDRLRTPLLRQPDGSLAAVSWDEAFAAVETGLNRVIAEHGRDAVAYFYGNPIVHTIALPLYSRVLREMLGSRNVFGASTIDQMPKNVSCGLMFGDPWAVPVPDIDRTSHLLVIGANPMVSHGSMWTVPDLPGRLRALRARGGRLVVVDPRRTRTAEVADEYVPARPGTDVHLLFAMVHTLFAEGLAVELDEAGFAGLDQLRQAAGDFTPEAVSEVCGIAPGTIRKLARDLAAAPTAAVYARFGACTTEFGTLTNYLVDVLNVLTGNLDRPGGVMFGEAQHNALVATEPLVLGRWHSRVRGLPEVVGEFPVATLADEIDTPGDGQVRAVLMVASNPVLGAPNGERLDRSLAGLDFMVAVDCYLNETTRHADVILPPPRLLQTGHFDIVLSRMAVRRVARYSPPALPLEPGQPSESAILAKLALIAGGFGAGADPAALDEMIIDRTLQAVLAAPGSPFAGRDPAELKAMLTGADSVERRLDLMIRLSTLGDAFGLRPDGLNLAALVAHPQGIDVGALRPRLNEVLVTASGKVELYPEPVGSDVQRLAKRLLRGEVPGRDAADGGLLLIGRRNLRSANGWTHNVPALSGGSNRCTLEINPADAGRLHISPGQPVTVRSRAGSIEVTADVTDRVAPGVVSLPHGWGHGRDGARLRHAAKDPGASANALTDELVVDRLSGTAVFNAVPVRVTPAVA